MTPIHIPSQDECRRAVRDTMDLVLTSTQNRRVALLYGFNGKPLSERQAAKREGVSQRAIQKSRDQAFERLRRNATMALHWAMIPIRFRERYDVE